MREHFPYLIYIFASTPAPFCNLSFRRL